MPLSNLLERILTDSEYCLNWIIALNHANDVKDIVSIAHRVSHDHRVRTFPYFADRNFSLESLFAERYTERLLRRHLITTSPLRLTRRGDDLQRRSPINDTPVVGNVSILLPYSNVPANELNIGSRTVRAKLQIGETELILTGLLPPDPSFFFVFSHFDKDAMRTAYPLLKDGSTFVALYTGDIRNVMAVPEISILKACYKSFSEYLTRYIDDFEKYVEVVVYLLMAVGKIQFAHQCHSRVKTLNKMNDRFHIMLDFSPSCSECNMAANHHMNLVDIRHSLGRAWEKGVLSELFFSKLVADAAHQIDESIDVYPRLTLEGLPHECDTFVRKNNRVILFELKRSEVYDGWCQEGVTQLTENKEALENWGVDCVSVLVTNMKTRRLPAEAAVDAHIVPQDVTNIKSKLESLLT
jgi:hypothetical protein